jgi:hypothetical protein
VQNWDSEGLNCRIQYTEEASKRFFALYVAFVVFLVPLFVMGIAYGQTAVALWRSVKLNRHMMHALRYLDQQIHLYLL